MSLLRRRSSTLKPLPQPVPPGYRLVLYVLSFLSMSSALAAAAQVSGQYLLFAAAIALTGGGHAVSALTGKSRAWLTLALYLGGMGSLGFMLPELLQILHGGSLFPLGKLLAVVLVMTSFNLRSLRTLYDCLLLSLALLLIASESALSAQFASLVGTFSLAAIAFLYVAHQSKAFPGAGRVRAMELLRHTPMLLIVAILVSLFGAAVFMVLPQRVRVESASPLPSRLDLASGLPALPSDLDPQQNGAPLQDGLLPSHNPTGDAATSSPTTPSSLTPTSPSSQIADAIASKYEPLGYTGDAGKDLVMYVRSPLASFWRGQVLEYYDGRGWSSAYQSPRLKSDPLGRLQFTDAWAWQGSLDTYTQTFFLKTDQPSAVFTGYGPGLIALSDGVAVPRTPSLDLGYLQKAGVSYRVTSARPALTPDSLEQDRADRSYLRYNKSAAPSSKVHALAAKIVQNSASDYQKAVMLEQYLLTNYQYDLRLTPLPTSTDAVEHFLFSARAGFCAHFASAMALMARSLGLPVRVVTGYLPGRYDPLSGVHVVRQQDAHAWVEIKFQRHGWVPFDPTPRPDSPWALDPGAARTASNLQQALITEIQQSLGSVTGFVETSAASISASAQTPITKAALSGAGFAFLSLGLVVAARRRRPLPLSSDSLYASLDSVARIEIRASYLRALKVLARRGFPPRLPHQSPGYYLESLLASAQVPHEFAELTGIASQALYSPDPPSGVPVQRARMLLAQLRNLPQSRRRSHRAEK
ncbi:MAG: DUF4129 domain-containing protein [SAR202 cluster bacterium]|nr:DUF4129 domain-containing protein [SAR202 cluster bacterium]